MGIGSRHAARLKNMGISLRFHLATITMDTQIHDGYWRSDF